MGGGKGGTTTSSVAIPPEVLARYNSVNARAETAAGGAFQPYTGQFVAGMTPTQQAGVANTNAASRLAQPFYQAGTGLTMQGAQSVGPLTQGQIGYYQDPFTQSVVDPTRAALQQDQGQQRAQQQAQQIKSGAFGGDRAGLERANLARQQNLGMAQAIAPLYSQGYQTGVQTAAGQQGVISSDLQRKLAAGQQVAGLGTGAQGAALQGAQQQLAAGTAEQQTQQADLTAQYQQFLQQQGFPYQQAQFLANIAMGTGALSGSTTTTQAPTGFFSDRRLKHDVHEIGETHDGQPIYSYKYKGDDKTQIGLMAQDVEKHHPEAVGVMGGYKTVDYGKATEDSERPERATGGVIPNSMGGGVWHPDAYAGGGLVDADDMKSILQAQQAGFGPFGGQGSAVYGGSGAGTPGGRMQGVVPQASLPVPKLVTAGSPPARQASGLSQAASVGSSIASTGRAAVDFKNWVSGLGSKPADKTNNGAATAPVAQTSKDIPVAETGKAIPVSGAKPDPNAYKGPTRGADAGGLGGGTQLASADVPSFGADDFSFAAARGGVIPFRHHRASGGVNPYELSDDMSYIPSSVLKEGEEEAEQAAGQFKKNTSGGGGGGGGSSPFGDIAKVAGTAKTLFDLGTAAASMFSDERMKDNIKHVGKTFDGQKIYSYDMGDGRTQMGLLAQEVLRHKPEAVGENRGYLTVDYSKATEDSAPHKAIGGVVPRHGYALDGAVDPTSDQPVYDPRADMPSENAIETAARPDESIVAPVSERPRATDDVIRMLMGKVEKGESGGVPDASLKGANAINSTASGLHGMLDSTWQSSADKAGIDWRGKGWTRAADAPATVQRDVAMQYAVPNARRLEAEGLPVNHQTMRAMNFIPAAAPNILKLPDDTVLSPDVLIQSGWPEKNLAAALANPINRSLLQNKDGSPITVAQFKAKMGGEGGGGGGERRPGVVSGESPIGRASTLGDVFKSVTPDSIPSNENFWIPALAGLGSMLASSRPTLLGAVGEGLVGGVSGYQAQQKQEMERAKQFIDFAKENFVQTYDPASKQTVQLNKMTGQMYSGGDFQKYMYDSMKKAGITKPEVYGVMPPSGPSAPGEKQPMTQNVPSKAQEVAEKAAPSTVTSSATTPAPNVDNPSENIYTANPGQLRALVISGKIPGGPPDAAARQAQIDEDMKTADAMANNPNPDIKSKGIQMRQIAVTGQQMLDDKINKTLELQLEQNKEFAKGRAVRINEYQKDVQGRAPTYVAAIPNLKRMADLALQQPTGIGSETAAKAVSLLERAGFGRYIPENWKDTASTYDQMMKLATQQMLNQLLADKIIRAPASGLQYEAATVPGPNSAPGAYYALIGSKLAEVMHTRDKDLAWTKTPVGSLEPATHDLVWPSQKGQRLDDYKRRAFNELPVSSYVPPVDIRSLQETNRDPDTGETFQPRYAKPPAGTPAGTPAPGSTEAAPAAPAAPVVVKNDADFDKIPSGRGIEFIGPDGKIRRKP